MFDSKKLLGKLGNVINTGINGAQQVYGKVSESQVKRESQNNTTHSMYEVFIVNLGMNKKFVITESSFIYGTEEYDYSQLAPIRIVCPAEKLINGRAVTQIDGKEINLYFEYSQNDRFIKAMNYANEQIDIAHGTVHKYKYVFQSKDNSKIEVYEDYIILYLLKSGISNIWANSVQNGSNGIVVNFSDISLELQRTAESSCLQISYQNGVISIEVDTENEELVEKIIAYINEKKNSKTEETEYIPEDWEQIVGNEKHFELNGKTLVISPNMDIFNTYRKKFNELAQICADNARKEYDKKVQNLTTYLEFLPDIYAKHLKPIAKRAIDILISENIWSETLDSFISNHVDRFNLVMKEYSNITESIELTVQKNQGAVSSVMSFVPNLAGGGFGVKGAAKGIATATAFNLIRDGAEAGMLKGASQLSYAQQEELYQRVNPDNTFHNVFLDYWRVFLSLIMTLNNNKKGIWVPTDKSAEEARNIFQNLSNPRFPQNQLLDVFLDILKTNPYDEEYQNFMIEKFGDTEETREIKNYFNV